MPVYTELLAELKHEATGTRKMLEKVPDEKLLWKPHEKSMSLGRMATHIADIPVWAERILLADEFDFSKAAYKTIPTASVREILERFDKRLHEAVTLLETTSDEKLNQPFTLRSGEKIFFTLPKKVVLRNFAFNHIYHHRGQLSVYLRLLDIAVPGMYGPSADEIRAV